MSNSITQYDSKKYNEMIVRLLLSIRNYDDIRYAKGLLSESFDILRYEETKNSQFFSAAFKNDHAPIDEMSYDRSMYSNADSLIAHHGTIDALSLFFAPNVSVQVSQLYELIFRTYPPLYLKYLRSYAELGLVGIPTWSERTSALCALHPASFNVERSIPIQASCHVGADYMYSYYKSRHHPDNIMLAMTTISAQKFVNVVRDVFSKANAMSNVNKILLQRLSTVFNSILTSVTEFGERYMSKANSSTSLLSTPSNADFVSRLSTHQAALVDCKKALDRINGSNATVSDYILQCLALNVFPIAADPLQYLNAIDNQAGFTTYELPGAIASYLAKHFLNAITSTLLSSPIDSDPDIYVRLAQISTKTDSWTSSIGGMDIWIWRALHMAIGLRLSFVITHGIRRQQDLTTSAALDNSLDSGLYTTTSQKYGVPDTSLLKLDASPETSPGLFVDDIFYPLHYGFYRDVDGIYGSNPLLTQSVISDKRLTTNLGLYCDTKISQVGNIIYVWPSAPELLKKNITEFEGFDIPIIPFAGILPQTSEKKNKIFEFASFLHRLLSSAPDFLNSLLFDATLTVRARFCIASLSYLAPVAGLVRGYTTIETSLLDRAETDKLLLDGVSRVSHDYHVSDELYTKLADHKLQYLFFTHGAGKNRAFGLPAENLNAILALADNVLIKQILSAKRLEFITLSISNGNFTA